MPTADWEKLLQSLNHPYQPQPIELPDDFTAWVEEVRKKNRIEELVKVLYDKFVAKPE